MKTFLLVLSAGLFLSGSVLCAQVPPPNAAGVAMGHLHLNVPDVEAAKKFWITMGGVPEKLGPLELVKFPDVLVFLKQAQPTGGSVGTIVNHVGFRVPNVQAAMAKWKAAGLHTEAGNRPTQGFVFTPEELRIEILEDATMGAPIANHHIHFFVTKDAVPEIKAWYAQTFGAKPGKRGDYEADDIPGANLTFSVSPSANAPTQGRALDHIGFEVKNLEAFCKKLEESGVKFDRPYNKVMPNLAIAFFTDPWGTYIELTEGLDKL
jgi:catechol 2,3-dioxygenase-like lactoylglutathione lyase family enzyme